MALFEILHFCYIKFPTWAVRWSVFVARQSLRRRGAASCSRLTLTALARTRAFSTHMTKARPHRGLAER
jgi:hypothetical protein